MKPRHRVLVIDDSAFARKVLREILAADPRLEVVGFARDGLDALEKIAELKPDVVTLDLMMPELDGVGVLQALADRGDAPRVVVVTMTDADSIVGVDALERGAIDVVHKPTALATDRLYELSKELVEKVVSAAESSSAPRSLVERRITPGPRPALVSATRATRLLVIGASTGGPRALTEILRALPADFPIPIAAVLHMPVGYTEAFAARLDETSPLRVREADHGMLFGRGDVILGRAGRHLRIELADDALRVAIDGTADGALHRPSVDVLFTSAAEKLGSAVLGVVLTGMGNDGLLGSRAIRAAGGRIIAEAESSCVVYGMPRAVAEDGIGAEIAPLELMIETILARI